MWTFRCYIEAEDSDVIRAWYDAQDEAVQGELDGIIEILRYSPRKWWRMKRFRHWQGEQFVGMGAIRIEVDDVHYRITGFFGPDEESEFTLLVPFNKDDDPHYAVSRPEALLRKQEVIDVEEHSHECSFP